MLSPRALVTAFIGGIIIVLLIVRSPAMAEIEARPPNQLVSEQINISTRPPSPSHTQNSPAIGRPSAPAGAHRPHSRPFDLRYDDTIGLCNGGGNFTLPGSEQPVGWTLQGCPPGPRKPGGGGRPALPSPRDAALSVWWQTTLPDPTMATSPPEGAITGLPLYLQLGGPQTLAFDAVSYTHLTLPTKRIV